MKTRLANNRYVSRNARRQYQAAERRRRVVRRLLEEGGPFAVPFGEISASVKAVPAPAKLAAAMKLSLDRIASGAGRLPFHQRDLAQWARQLRPQHVQMALPGIQLFQQPRPNAVTMPRL